MAEIVVGEKVVFHLNGDEVYYVYFGQKFKLLHLDAQKPKLNKMRRIATLIRNGDIKTVRKLYSEIDEDIVPTYRQYWELPK